MNHSACCLNRNFINHSIKKKAAKNFGRIRPACAAYNKFPCRTEQISMWHGENTATLKFFSCTINVSHIPQKKKQNAGRRQQSCITVFQTLTQIKENRHLCLGKYNLCYKKRC